MVKKVLAVVCIIACMIISSNCSSPKTCFYCNEIIEGKVVTGFGEEFWELGIGKYYYCSEEHKFAALDEEDLIRRIKGKGIDLAFMESDIMTFDDPEFESFLCEMFNKEKGTITGADLLSVKYMGYYEGAPTEISYLYNCGQYKELYDNSVLFSTEEYPIGVDEIDVLCDSSFGEEVSDIAKAYRENCFVVTVRSNEWMAEHVMPYLCYFRNMKNVAFGYCWVSEDRCLPLGAHEFHINTHSRYSDDPYDPMYANNDLLANQPTIEEQETTPEITVNDMRDGFPYILSGDTIKRLDCIGPYYEFCFFINHEDYEKIPRLASDEQLIVRSDRNDFDHVVLEPIEITYDEFVNPYYRFYYNYDGQLLFNGNYEVEDTKLPFWYIDNPLAGSNSYFLYSNDSSDECTVGYWEGTQYSEITLETKYMPFTKLSRIECSFTRTRNGYSIIDLSDFESGYYIIRGFSYKKGENGGRGYLVYIDCGNNVIETKPVEESITSVSAYINEMKPVDKFGKVWMRSVVPLYAQFHEKQDAPGCWKDMSTPGQTLGEVTDNKGNIYTYGLHLDGPDSSEYYISYGLNGEYTKFTGTCAFPGAVISEAFAHQYSKYFLVYGDGELLFTSQSMRYDQEPQSFEIDVTNVQTLTILYPSTNGPNEAATLYDGCLIN